MLAASVTEWSAINKEVNPGPGDWVGGGGHTAWALVLIGGGKSMSSECSKLLLQAATLVLPFTTSDWSISGCVLCLLLTSHARVCPQTAVCLSFPLELPHSIENQVHTIFVFHLC